MTVGEHRQYQPGIVVLGGWRDQHMIGLALDTLKERSKTALTLIDEVAALNVRNGGRLSIKTGALVYCDCPNCKGRGLHNAYDPIKNIVGWTPIGCMYDGSRSWMCPPQEILLAHELVHAHHRARGELISYNVHPMSPLRLYEEYRTVGIGEYANERLSENAIRRDYGVAQRPVY